MAKPRRGPFSRTLRPRFLRRSKFREEVSRNLSYAHWQNNQLQLLNSRRLLIEIEALIAAGHHRNTPLLDAEAKLGKLIAERTASPPTEEQIKKDEAEIDRWHKLAADIQAHRKGILLDELRRTNWEYRSILRAMESPEFGAGMAESRARKAQAARKHGIKGWIRKVTNRPAYKRLVERRKAKGEQ